MNFENRREYDEWIDEGQILEEDVRILPSVPECEKCNFQQKIIDYEKHGYEGVHKTCRICLGLGRYKTKGGIKWNYLKEKL